MTPYRPVPKSDREVFDQLRAHAFAPKNGPKADTSVLHDKPDGDPWGLYDDEQLVCVCNHHKLRLYTRGKWRSFVGLSDITTRLECRHEGNFHRLLRSATSEAISSDAAFVALWPSTYSLYRKAGFALASKFAAVQFSPEQLAITKSTSAGKFQSVGRDNWQKLATIYDTFSTQWDLAFERTDLRWRQQVLVRNNQPVFAYVWTDPDGVDAGYILYTIADGTVRIRDIVYRDEQAYINLLRLLYYYDGQAETIHYYGPASTPIFHYLARPNEASFSIHPAGMIRLADVETAVNGLPRNNMSDPVVVKITDPLDQTEGTYCIHPEEKTVQCKEMAEYSADITLDVATLSKLIIGVTTLPKARTHGDVTVHTDSTPLESVFPPRTRWFREYI
jgi:predicted acetyltransferase